MDQTGFFFFFFSRLSFFTFLLRSFAHGKRRGCHLKKRCRCHCSGIACCISINSRSTPAIVTGIEVQLQSSARRCTSIAGTATYTCECPAERPLFPCPFPMPRPSFFPWRVTSQWGPQSPCGVTLAWSLDKKHDDSEVCGDGARSLVPRGKDGKGEACR